MGQPLHIYIVWYIYICRGKPVCLPTFATTPVYVLIEAIVLKRFNLILLDYFFKF